MGTETRTRTARSKVKSTHCRSRIRSRHHTGAAAARRMRFDMDDLDDCGYTLGCPRCKAKHGGELGVNHNSYCRTRIEEKIRVDDPGRYMRTLAEGTLKEGTWKEGALKDGTLKRDERKARDIEIRKKIKQGRKEEKNEEIRKKAEAEKIRLFWQG